MTEKREQVKFKGDWKENYKYKGQGDLKFFHQKSVTLFMTEKYPVYDVM